MRDRGLQYLPQFLRTFLNISAALEVIGTGMLVAGEGIRCRASRTGNLPGFSRLVNSDQESVRAVDSQKGAEDFLREFHQSGMPFRFSVVHWSDNTTNDPSERLQEMASPSIQNLPVYSLAITRPRPWWRLATSLFKARNDRYVHEPILRPYQSKRHILRILFKMLYHYVIEVLVI